MTVKNIYLVAAARPNFMKVAPLYHALTAESWCRPAIVHTGQHYDANMSDSFFADLQLPDPLFHLGVGSGSHAEQTAGVMMAYEKICLQTPPDLTVVVGDVNSTMACTLAAKKLDLAVAHLEAGLRSRDWTMPEEINRIVTDSIADILWTPSPDGDENLIREGVSPTRISRVGNIMIDSFERLRARIEGEAPHEEFALTAGHFGVVTLHRPSNVDAKADLEPLVASLTQVARRVPLLFPLHPRTARSLESHGLMEAFRAADGIHITEPLNYIRFMGLVCRAGLVITDSGGIQEETTYLGIPCMTLRDTTERPITIEQGTNHLTRVEDLTATVDRILAGDWEKGHCPEFWDGRTAERVVSDLKVRLGI